MGIREKQPSCETELMTIAQASEAIRDGSCSPVELVSKCLARIDTLQPQINAFITVTDADAIREARFAESDIREGRWRGPLHGSPIGIKDFYDTAGVPTTAAYEPFKRRITKTDAVAVQRLGAPSARKSWGNRRHMAPY